MMRVLRSLLRLCIPERYRPLARLRASIEATCGGDVLSGPFVGLKYATTSFGSVYLPKLLGTYELELAEVVEKLKKADFEQVIVAGAAEGYYAVGCASWSSVVGVVAYEANTSAHPQLLEMARRNEVVHKVQVRGLCDCSELNASLLQSGKMLLIVDVEGAESVLLDPIVVPRLREVTLLVEMHDCFVPGLYDLMLRRFRGSHRIARIEARARTMSDWPKAMAIPPAIYHGAALAALNEGRPEGMYWLLLEPSVDTLAKDSPGRSGAAS